MKRSSLYILFLSLMILISSCGSGLSEEEKSTIEKFEVEWTANIDFADYLYSEIIHTKKTAEVLYANPSNDTLPDNSKLKYENINISEIKKLENKYFALKKSLEKENQIWMETKQNAMSGNLEWEEIENKINSMRNTIKTTQEQISSGLKTIDKIRKSL